MRPRLTNVDLPKGVRFRHGAYYKIVNRRWVRLGTELDMATYQAQLLALCDDHKEILEYARKVLGRARQNARGRRKIEFSLVIPDAYEMLCASNWRCAVTGMRFSFEVIAGKRPFAPSIDRIDSSIGYVKSNCRIVSVAANYAMNVWGAEVLHRMIASVRKQPRKASPNVSPIIVENNA